MTRRSQVVLGTAFAVIGLSLVLSKFIGVGELSAAGVNDKVVDYAKYLVWAGVAFLVGGAFLFISASSK